MGSTSVMTKDLYRVDHNKIGVWKVNIFEYSYSIPVNKVGEYTISVSSDAFINTYVIKEYESTSNISSVTISKLNGDRLSLGATLTVNFAVSSNYMILIERLYNCQ